jgi:hypothetical protein
MRNKITQTVLVFILMTNVLSAQVLINEVVTTPLEDWSGSGFTYPSGGGNINDGTDEWIELYVGSDGLDLTDWTIELIDGSNVIGDLSGGGTSAFQTIIYVGTGSFTNTIQGDYIVLGNVKGSGSMDDNVLLTLKDDSGSTIDEIKLGGGATEAPIGFSNDIATQSVQRDPSGVDTDADHIDFTQGFATIGSENDAGALSVNSNNKLNFSYYPSYNVQDKVFIKSSELITGVSLYDQTGRLLIELNTNSNELSINVRVLKEGIYFCTIKGENSTKDYFKFVK